MIYIFFIEKMKKIDSSKLENIVDFNIAKRNVIMKKMGGNGKKIDILDIE